VGDPHPEPTAENRPSPHPKLHATAVTRTFGRPPRTVDALGLLRPSTGTLEIAVRLGHAAEDQRGQPHHQPGGGLR